MNTGHATPPALQDDSPGLWDSGYGRAARSLLSSGVRCFATNGFHATTTRDITKVAGLSPAALYVHFPSKEQVLFEITHTAHQRSLAVLREIDSVEPAATEPAARLRALVARFVTWHARHHVAARVAQYELNALTPQHHEAVAALRRQSTAVFHRAVADCAETGGFGAVDIHRTVRAILSLGVDLVRWYRLDGPDTPEGIGAFYAELAMGMLHAAGRAAPAGDQDHRLHA